MVQPLFSHEAAKRYNNTTFKVSLTAREIDFMIFQMEASIIACRKAGGKNVEENPHFQGLERLSRKYQKALPSWKV